MLFSKAPVFFVAVSILIGGSGAAETITFASSAADTPLQNVVTTFNLDAALSTGPTTDTINVDYYATSCTGPALSTGLVSVTDLTTVSDTVVTITDDINAVDTAIGIQGDTMVYCMRLSLFSDTTLIDIEEVIITLTVTRDGSITTIGNVDGDANTPGSGGPSATFTATAYQCDPGDLATAVTTIVLEGAPFSICFQSDEWDAAGIVDLTALTLTSTLNESGGSFKSQDFFAGGAPLFDTNTCEATGSGGANGDGTPLAAAVQRCYVTINQIPTTFFLDGDANDDAVDITVTGTATVTLQVGNVDGNGRRLEKRKVRFLLEEGETGPVGAEIVPFSASSRPKNSCGCSGGVFFIICWFFKCFLGLF